MYSCLYAVRRKTVSVSHFWRNWCILTGSNFTWKIRVLSIAKGFHPKQQLIQPNIISRRDSICTKFPISIYLWDMEPELESKDSTSVLKSNSNIEMDSMSLLRNKSLILTVTSEIWNLECSLLVCIQVVSY